MVNYQNSKVYKIINENNEIIYIGSTAEKHLSQRFQTHRHKSPNNKIILIENYPCNNREELRKREQEIIEEHSNLLNEIRAYRSEEQKLIYSKTYNSHIINCKWCNCEMKKSRLKPHNETLKCFFMFLEKC
jgi:hypothetical protein|tara:strand:- start:143 stop:535 length:393 start_codon:yes stop_codon:yes gene_type:complete